jgi:hypothetical protein
MKILTLFPPNYAAINRTFRCRGKRVIFCYGDTIYNPSRVVVGPELIAHERVHSGQQNGKPSEWWQRYIDDPAFRLSQEIPAHAAEYRVSGRLEDVARRLCSPLYGNLISFERACEVIR